MTRFVGPGSRIWRLIEKTSVLDSFSCAKRMECAPWGPTCNISYRKSILEAVGKFDTSFPFRLGGDDVDLGLRVTDSGYKIKCNPQAVVEHTQETWNKLRLIGRRVFRWGRMHFHLMRKHPARIIYDFPKAPGLLLLLVIATIVSAAIARRYSLLLLPLAWLAATISIESLLMCWLEGRGIGQFWQALGARMLNLAFETGTLLEALRHGSIEPLYKEIYYNQPTPQSPGRNRRIIQIGRVCWRCSHCCR